MPGSLIDNPERLAAVYRSGLMDSPLDAAFDALVELARDLLGGMAALMSLVDDSRQFFKAQVGLGEPWASARQTPLSHSFCQLVVKQCEPVLVENARLDARVKDNAAIDDLGVIAYAGVPLVDEGDHALGALCVVDGQPRQWTEQDVRTLKSLARAVMAEVHLRQALARQQREAHEREQLLERRALAFFGAGSPETARERVEALSHRLAEREQLLRMALASADLSAWFMDCRTRLITADAHFMDLYGLQASGPVPLAAVIARVHPEERPGTERAIEAALAGENGGRYLSERRIRGPSGAYHWGETRAQVTFAPDGTALTMQGVSFDVTARKETEALREELLQRTQAESDRQRLLFEQAPAAIALLEGPEHRFRIANARCLQLAGGREVHGRSVAEALPEAVEQGFIALLDTVRRTGVPYVGRETWLQLQRRPGGPLEEACLDFIYQPIRDAGGEVDMIFVHAVEVTDLVRSREVARRAVRELEITAERLHRSETRLALALEVSGTGMWEMDLTTGLFPMDARFREMFGLPHDTPVTLAEGLSFVHPEDRARVSTGVADALAGKKGGAYAAEYRTVQQADGSYRWVSARGQAYFGPDGQAVHLAGTGLDITESVRARERSEELARQERLRAEFAQQLIGIVSHDLRTPLGAVRLGVATLQLRKDLDPKAVRTLGRMQSATDRAERMVRDLLDFTQVRLAGGLKIERQPADFHELVRGVVQEVEDAQPGARIHQEARGAGEGAWDADRLQQVVQNLLTNALKYGTPGERVDVVTGGDGDTVTLSVHNRGAPIPPERQAAIFQPMQRGVEGVDRQGRSVGLGLFIVRAIVEAHGGTIELTSREGEGTTFRVLLPREAPGKPAPSGGSG